MTALNSLLDVLKGALTFMIVLPILVAVHELGHFWVARLFGMHVEAFAVMMGGVRKTDLEPYLASKLVSKKIVWAVGGAFLATLVTGSLISSLPVVYVGLLGLGVAMPVWVVTRLGALYHLGLMGSLGVLVKSWALAVVLSFAATRGQGLDTNQLLGLVSLASFLGVLIVYYHPVFRKSEDAPHGHGQIQLEDDQNSADSNLMDSLETAGTVPVRFRPLLSRTDKHGTEFALLCWPLGGFAAIKGMHPKEDGSETLIDKGFYSKSPFARFCVLFAGPLFSVLFGVVLLAANFAISGRMVASTEPVIGGMGTEAMPMQETAAYKAGLRVGDRVIEVNGQKVTTFFDMVKIVRSSVDKTQGDKPVAREVALKVERGSEVREIKVTPIVDKDPTPVLDDKMQATGERAIQAKLGVRSEIVTVPVGLGEAISEASKTPGALVVGLAQTFSKPASIAENVGGPAAIAKQMTDASKQGPDQVIINAGLLSVSLGVMNLLPIVPFDGGQIVIAIAEMFRGGKRLSIRLQSVLSTMGVFLIFALMITVVTLDISKFAK